jgi:hypothetical protein
MFDDEAVDEDQHTADTLRGKGEDQNITTRIPEPKNKK